MQKITETKTTTAQGNGVKTTTQTTKLKAVGNPNAGGIAGIVKKTGIPLPILAAGLVLFLIIVIGLIAFAVNTSNKKAEAAQRQQIAAQQAEQEKIEAEKAKKEAPPAYLLEIPDTHWARQSVPLDALAQLATTNAATTSPSADPQGLRAGNGDIIQTNSPDYTRILSQVKMNIITDLNRTVQTATNPEGVTVLSYLNPQTGKFEPVQDSQIIKNVEAQAMQTAASELANQLSVFQPPKQEQAPQPALIPESVITAEEKAGYLKLIELQRQENRDLRDTNKKLAKEIGEQQRSVTTILQKIEDSPNANNRLRASMLPEKTGLKVQAIVGDRVWLKDKSGKLQTLSIGDIVPDSELRISDLDENTGLVFVVPK